LPRGPHHLIGARRGDLCRGAWPAAGYTGNVPGSITLRDLLDHERAWANARYRAIQFAATPPDAVALVAELDGARVGLGRLVAYAPDVLELGGIWTDEAARGHGVARAMVAALLDRLARGGHAGPVWCIPFAHLSAFYRSFGFAVQAPPWPAPIAAKVADCITHALPEVVVLARERVGAPVR
jgi:GNAT superfamily N-acetyltransferase